MALPGDDPQAYLARDRRWALAGGPAIPDRVHGSAVFVDVSGFTSLTEALAGELGRRQGADEVSAILGAVTAALIDCVHAWGGEVIYFSGDALTCWLDGDDGARAVACGLALQQTMSRVGTRTTPAGSVVRLGAKVAVAVGAARRFVVGDPRVQRIEVLAGRLVDDLAAAEQGAHVGEVVLARSALASLGDRVVLAGPAGPGAPAVVAAPAVAAVPPPPAPPPPDLPEEVVAEWLLPAVYERMRSGQGEFLAELRPAVPLFVSFGGIDHDGDPDAPARLDEFVVEAQRIVDAYGGSTLQLTLGDKGAYLYAVFGSPLAHEDDDARACAAALELLALDGRTAATGLAIGIARGRLRSGTYGHPQRRTFCCLGNDVNLSARLMSAASPGEVFVSGKVRAAAGDRFAWTDLAPLRVKGRREPVPVSRLEGMSAHAAERAARLALRFTDPMLGRDDALASAMAGVEEVLAGRGQVLRIVAEAGMGKSRLVAEVVRALSRHGVPVAAGQSPAFGAETSYMAWREVWWELLDLPAEATPALLADRLAAVDPALVPRLALLGPVLNLPLPDSELTRDFDAKLRKASLEDLLANLLAGRARGPLAVVLEDAHLLDPLSTDLLGVLARRIGDLPVLLVVAGRPVESGDDPLAGVPQRTITLGPLADDVVHRIVRTEAPALPDALVERVVERAEGNPFYVAELLTYLASEDVGDLSASADAVDLPESLSTLVLSRIDTLPEGPRRAAKVASVVGRSFTPPDLRGVHPDLGPAPAVVQQVEVLTEEEVLALDDLASLLHSFRHVITREVAYESLPADTRAHLHERAGDHLSRTLGADGRIGDQLLDVLAYHYGRGRDPVKKKAALLVAGRAAQARYANQTAIAHYSAVLPLLADEERGDVQLRLGQVQELTGDWDRARESYEQALGLARRRGDGAAAGWALTALAEIARKQGRFADAGEHLSRAQASFQGSGPPGDPGRDAGIGRVMHLRGTLAAQQGHYDAARDAYRASLGVREASGDRAGVGALLSNLAVVAEYTGDYPTARALNEQALAVRREVGDRAAIAVSQNNLGMITLLQKDFVEARQRFTEAMRLAEEVGEPWLVAVAHNNLANALRGLGDLDRARHEYALALTAYQRFDDQWAIAILLEDLAVAAVGLGARDDALLLLGAAGAMRERLGSPRPDSLAAELTDAVGVADGDDALLHRGAGLSGDAAVALALRICSG